MVGQVVGSEPDEPGLFPPIHGVGGSTVGRGPTRLDLDKHEHISVRRDEIELSSRRPDISLKDAVPFAAQVSFGFPFGVLPEPARLTGHSVRSLRSLDPRHLTGVNVRRCASHGPCSASRRKCSGVVYPLLILKRYSG